MPSSRKATTLVVTLLVAALMAAVLFPVAIGAISGPEVATATLDTGNTTELQPGLNATLDSVDDTADTATYTVSADGETATATVGNGTNTTVTVDGTDVTIGVTDVTTTSATADFEYPTTYGWGSGAAALWGILPVLLVLGIFLFLVALALGQR